MGGEQITIVDEAHCASVAADLALVAEPGDLICLSGDLGAGKTHFARAFIRALQGDRALEVPSPTYLIAINYPADAGISVNHLDLYRVQSSDEMDELAVEEMLEAGIVLVEWPENAQGNLPQQRLSIDLQITGENTRLLKFDGNTELANRFQRSLLIRNFLSRALPGDILRASMPADASTRHFEIVNSKDTQYILLDAPRQADGPPIQNGLPYSQIAHLAEEVRPFVAIGQLLRSNGFYAPQIIAYGLDDGLVLMEDLGRGKIVDAQNMPIGERYIESGKLLAQINEIVWPAEIAMDDGSTYQIPPYDPQAMKIESTLLAHWYLKDGYTIDDDGLTRYAELWNQYSATAQAFEKSLVQRDFHSPNIVWRAQAQGNARIGLVDFQDALIGPAAYDLASLAQDARTCVSVELENSIVDHYIDLRKRSRPGFDERQFRFEYAMMGALRASKILGFCVRVHLRDGKPQYRKLIPFVRDYLKRNLQHEGLHEYQDWCARYIEL